MPERSFNVKDVNVTFFIFSKISIKIWTRLLFSFLDFHHIFTLASTYMIRNWSAKTRSTRSSSYTAVVTSEKHV